LLFEKKGVGVWNTQQLKATLKAGNQTIRVGFKRGGLKLNWWSISQNTDIPSAIDGVNTGHSSVYPNPVMDKLYITGSEANVSVFDLSGKKLQEQKHTNSVNVSSLKAGLYLVTVQSLSGEKSIHKVIKK
jgi:hypothetical protein